MNKFLCGLAVVPFLSAAALAQPASTGLQPVQLSEHQMDSVTAGFGFREVDVSNTSWTEVLLWQPTNTVTCPNCYLLINNHALSVGSVFGQTPGT